MYPQPPKSRSVTRISESRDPNGQIVAPVRARADLSLLGSSPRRVCPGFVSKMCRRCFRCAVGILPTMFRRHPASASPPILAPVRDPCPLTLTLDVVVVADLQQPLIAQQLEVRSGERIGRRSSRAPPHGEGDSSCGSDLARRQDGPYPDPEAGSLQDIVGWKPTAQGHHGLEGHGAFSAVAAPRSFRRPTPRADPKHDRGRPAPPTPCVPRRRRRWRNRC